MKAYDVTKLTSELKSDKMNKKNAKSIKDVQGDWKWHHSLDCIRVPIRLPL